MSRLLKLSFSSLLRFVFALVCLGALLCSCSSASGAITCTGLVHDISIAPLNSTITFSPTNRVLVSGGNLMGGPARTITPTNGGFSLLLAEGNYDVTIGQKRAFTICVPGGSDTRNITNLICSGAGTYTYTNSFQGLVKVTSADTNPDFLAAKVLVAGRLAKTTNNAGANESLTISNNIASTELVPTNGATAGFILKTDGSTPSWTNPTNIIQGVFQPGTRVNFSTNGAGAVTINNSIASAELVPTTGATNGFILKTDGSVSSWVNPTNIIQGTIQPGANITMTTNGAGAVSIAGNAGTVTSVALTVPAEFSVTGSPVTSSGTLAVTKANQVANVVYAGPAAGGAAAPSFRALAEADIVNLAPGSDTEILFNNAGAFDTDSRFEYDPSSGIMQIQGGLMLGEDTIPLPLSFVINPPFGETSYLMNRVSVDNYCSADFVTGGDVFTGWSFNLQPGDTGFHFYDRALGQTKMYIEQATGRVAIGPQLDEPEAQLHVQASDANVLILQTSPLNTTSGPDLRIFQVDQATVDNTTTSLGEITLAESTIYLFEARVVARRTGGAAGTTDDGAAYIIRAAAKNIAGTATLIGAVEAALTREDQAGWAATIDVNADTLRVRITGAVDNNISWHGTIYSQPITQ